MSGHSKWHNIQKKKGAADSQRAVQFAKLAKAITVAAKQGGGDPSFNVSLRVAVDQAKRSNMPKDNIERAIKRGSGAADAGSIEEVVYEAFGPGGSSLLIRALTDNRNRAIGEVRTVVQKNGGTMASQGSVMWMFDHKGLITTQNTAHVTDKDEAELALIDAGAEEIEEGESGWHIVCDPTALKTVSEVVEKTVGDIESAELVYMPKEATVLEKEDEVLMEKLVTLLDDLEDVDRVFPSVV